MFSVVIDLKHLHTSRIVFLTSRGHNDSVRACLANKVYTCRWAMPMVQ